MDKRSIVVRAVASHFLVPSMTSRCLSACAGWKAGARAGTSQQSWEWLLAASLGQYSLPPCWHLGAGIVGLSSKGWRLSRLASGKHAPAILGRKMSVLLRESHCELGLLMDSGALSHTVTPIVRQ
jgi:hypothetical protein